MICLEQHILINYLTQAECLYNLQSPQHILVEGHRLQTGIIILQYRWGKRKTQAMF